VKLLRYSYRKIEQYGILKQNKVVALPKLAHCLNVRLPRKLEDLIALGLQTVEDVEKLVGEASEKDIETATSPLRKVKLLAPILSPPKIICLGLNYRDHAKEQDAVIPDEPIIFMKPHTAIIGPNENIVKPCFVDQLDYEAELVIVIGRKTKNVPISEAQFHIFGYSIMNDVSARDIQFKDRQWTRGKSFDTFAPIGPYIITANQLQDTSNLSIRTWVDGEPRQNSSTSNMVFNVSKIVHHLSRVMTLEPCDIIATGTPAGVGFAWKPQPKFLQAGNAVRIEIEKIGILENAVVDGEPNPRLNTPHSS